MQTIGERLEEARKRKGVSIREAAETTKIRSDYLQKFEANSFDVDLPPLYVRGFLRTYSRYLELDPERIVGEFDSLGGRERRPARRETRENFGRVDFAEPAAKAETAEGAEKSDDRSAHDQAVMLKYGLLAGGAAVAVVVVILLIKLIFSGSPAKPAAPQAATPTVQAEAAQTLTITATDATRIKIVQDVTEAVLFNGALTRGETRTFRKQGALRITVEDRTKVRIEVNGRLQQIPPLEGGNYGRFVID
jgi:cytoskeletal protein RodZ